MLTNKTVTVFRYDEDTDEYKKVGTYPAWVFLRHETVKAEGGFKRSGVLHVRIQREMTDSFFTGDMIALENAAAYDPQKCHRIMQATDNNFGGVPHWHLEAGG